MPLSSTIPGWSCGSLSTPVVYLPSTEPGWNLASTLSPKGSPLFSVSTAETSRSLSLLPIISLRLRYQLNYQVIRMFTLQFILNAMSTQPVFMKIGHWTPTLESVLTAALSLHIPMKFTLPLRPSKILAQAEAEVAATHPPNHRRYYLQKEKKLRGSSQQLEEK